MAFDHEEIDVYRLAVIFSRWVGERLEGSLKNSRTSATQHLNEASGSITNNIAEETKTLTNRRLPRWGT